MVDDQLLEAEEQTLPMKVAALHVSKLTLGRSKTLPLRWLTSGVGQRNGAWRSRA